MRIEVADEVFPYRRPCVYNRESMCMGSYTAPGDCAECQVAYSQQFRDPMRDLFYAHLNQAFEKVPSG